MAEKKKATIKEVAELAGVSIATVSHIINRTRYVSPELVEKVEKIMIETGYINKVSEKAKKLREGHASIIVAIVPNVKSAIYRDLVSYLQEQIVAQGYRFFVIITDEKIEEEKQILSGLMKDKRIAGILEIPLSYDAKQYTELINSKLPFVCIERTIESEKVDGVVFKDRESLQKATNYLLDCGHKNIMYLRESRESSTREERTRGFLDALEKHNLNINDANIIDLDLQSEEDLCQLMIQKAIKKVMPTAIVAGGNRLTLHLLKTFRNMGIECPNEISAIGFGDENWSELMVPPLTTLERDVKGISTKALNILFEKINTGNVISKDYLADVELKIRKSTKMLDNGPYGEEAVSPEEISLSSDEKKRLRNSKFRVAISFHYTGTAWAELHEKGIRDELEQFGIDVVSVMDAHFDSELQNVQLEGIRIQRPDAVIAVPTDDEATADKFRELSQVSKLVFISNVPENIGQNSYVSCVSVNEWENGSNAGRLMGEYFKGEDHVKVGFIVHGATFYGTRARDAAAETMIKENFQNIDIVSNRGFGQIENTYQVCKDMVNDYPDIKAIYVSWDQPALLAIRALKELHRQDIAVFTTDLDHDIASNMEEGIVKGLSTQRPYEQGRAAALVVAKTLVSDDVPKYVGVQPYIVDAKQLRRAWKDIFYESLPSDL
ncbi:MAG: LacI family DNA-binding transcriptional regulator [Lachnospiraceae bacterium]|nr:LacI family DNA-binding transcriptional regulator [Lachnospiraceae bacterium]